MVFQASEVGAYVILYSVLSFFSLLALATTPLISKFIPENIRSIFCITKNVEDGKDYFLSARNSASATSIALSFFASGMGGWVLFGGPELGAIPQISWIGVIGYSFASAFPATVIAYIGPMVRDFTTDSNAFSATDFARQRYGRIMQIIAACVSIFYMFIYLVAEMTGIASVYGQMVLNFDRSYLLSISIPLGIFTVFYTTIAGLPASIVTDKFQAGIIVVLVIMLLISITSVPENKISNSEFAKASNWTVDGFVVAVTLVFALLSAELFNQGNWQRVWAAESVPAMRKGFHVGAFLVFLLMMFCGIMGMLSYAKDPEAYEGDKPEKLTFLSFFDMVEPLPNFWHLMVLFFVTALAASSMDSLQNALASIVSRDLIKLGWSPLLISRIILIAINVPAIIMASYGYDVISLFLVADIVCATSVLPLFFGLQTNDKLGGFIAAPTELGAIVGCLFGVATVLVNGAINDFKNPFRYFWLENNAACALCGVKTMISFIVTPIISLIATYIFSFIDITVRGERAREPIIRVRFDDDEDTKADEVEDNFTDEK